MVDQPAMMELVRLPNTVMDIIFQKKKYSYLLFFQDYNLVQITNPHQKINWRYNMHRLTLHYLESMNYL